MNASAVHLYRLKREPEPMPKPSSPPSPGLAGQHQPVHPAALSWLPGLPERGAAKLRTEQTRYFLGFFVLAGVLAMMLALGLLIALLSVSVGQALSVVIPLADLLIITLGVLLLLDKNPFKALPQVQAPALRNPFFNAFTYGLLYGPIALPCSGPVGGGDLCHLADRRRSPE